MCSVPAQLLPQVCHPLLLPTLAPLLFQVTDGNLQCKGISVRQKAANWIHPCDEMVCAMFCLVAINYDNAYLGSASLGTHFPAVIVLFHWQSVFRDRESASSMVLRA